MIYFFLRVPLIRRPVLWSDMCSKCSENFNCVYKWCLEQREKNSHIENRNTCDERKRLEWKERGAGKDRESKQIEKKSNKTNIINRLLYGHICFSDRHHHKMVAFKLFSFFDWTGDRSSSFWLLALGRVSIAKLMFFVFQSHFQVKNTRKISFVLHCALSCSFHFNDWFPIEFLFYWSRHGSFWFKVEFYWKEVFKSKILLRKWMVYVAQIFLHWKKSSTQF